MERLKKSLSFLYKYSHLFIFVTGCLCIVLRSRIYSALPYLLGSIMLFIGVAGVTLGFLKLLVGDKKPQAFTYSLILTVLGTVFVVKATEHEVMSYIGIAWGILGVFRAGANIVMGIEQAKEKRLSSAVLFIEAAFTVTVSVLLLLEPVESISEHIVLYGIELIAVSVCSLFGIREGFSLWSVVNVNAEEKSENK